MSYEPMSRCDSNMAGSALGQKVLLAHYLELATLGFCVGMR